MKNVYKIQYNLIVTAWEKSVLKEGAFNCAALLLLFKTVLNINGVASYLQFSSSLFLERA